MLQSSAFLFEIKPAKVEKYSCGLKYNKELIIEFHCTTFAAKQ